MNWKRNKIHLSKHQLRELQLKEVEILSHVINAIKKMGLTYYCVGGTAIGSVKYGGFVPWDDDIDIAMPRDDYMKFLLDGKKYLPSNLFISSCFTEKKYFGSVAKIRDINTSFFEINTAKHKICHGVFVDIFPIDGYKPLSKVERFKRKVHIGKISFFEGTFDSFSGFFKGLICAFLCMFKSLNKCCLYVEKMLMKNKYSDCEMVYNRLMIFDKSTFGIATKGVFEGLEVSLPANINAYLSLCFGDINDIPPIEKRIPHHFALLIDINTPYANFKYKKGRVIKRC